MKTMNKILVNITTCGMNFLFMYLFTVTASFLKEMFYIEMDFVTVMVSLGFISVLSMVMAVLFREAMISELEQEEK